MYAMKCVVAEILRNFEIMTEPAEVEHKLLFMIEQTNGYPVKLVPRKSNYANSTFNTEKIK